MAGCALETIIATCDRYPQTVAVTFNGSSLTYTELSVEVSRIAYLLESSGIIPGKLVAVSLERSEKLLPVLLAIWCVGAAYLPIDPAYPMDRKKHMLNDASASLAIVGSVNSFDLEFSGDILSLDDLNDIKVEQSILDRGLHQWSHHWQPHNMAYMIYTSGSTGMPKGIAVSQANVHNFLLGMLERPGLGQQDTLLATTTICFDIHVLELFLPLMVGAAVHIVARYTAVSGDRLREYVDDNHITALQATPTTWRILLDGAWNPKTPLKIMVGGEAFPTDMIGRMLSAGSSVWNMYGPTETTVWSTCYQVSDENTPVKIGTPIRNTQVYVVDDKLQLVNQGEVGELLIGGDGVSMGYHNQEEKNQLSFIDNPFGSVNGHVSKLYRTGDLVRQLADESLVYIQRKDDQFKIRGYRIEAGDIEIHLAGFNGIDQAVVTVNQFAPGDDRLVAHVKSNGMINVQALRNYCKSKLPFYMVPQHFNQLNTFPQTENGKIDRKSLSVIKEFYSAESVEGPQFSSARDDLDLSILEVWRKQLGLHGLSIDENFVDLGGNSILAVKISEEMQKVTGIDFQADALFRYRTVREMVDSIGDDKVVEAASVLKLNNVKEGTPIFFLSGVQIYQDLTDALNNSHPIYAIYAKEELALGDQDNGEVLLSTNNLTRAYIDAIKRQYPNGPYILAGLSFGGMLAIDVANELTNEGIEVKLVAMFDSCLSHAKKTNPWGFLVSIFKSVVLHASKLTGFILAVLKTRLLSDGQVVGVFLDSKETIVEVDNARMKAYEEASERFAFGSLSYEGKVLLVKAKNADFGFGCSADPDYGWKNICGDNLCVDSVEAGHIDMMHSTKAHEVAGIMHKHIRSLES